MKKILLFAMLSVASIAFTGCAVKIPYRSLLHSVDYQRYYDANFYITEANSVSFEYEPVGNIFVSMRPGYEVLNTSKGGFITYSKTHKLVNEYDVLDEAKKEVEKLGGDGVINVKISYSNTAIMQSQWDGKMMQSAVEITVTGMAIKRK